MTWKQMKDHPRDEKDCLVYHRVHGTMEAHLDKDDEGWTWVCGDDVCQEECHYIASEDFWDDGSIVAWDELIPPPSWNRNPL